MIIYTDLNIITMYKIVSIVNSMLSLVCDLFSVSYSVVNLNSKS